MKHLYESLSPFLFHTTNTRAAPDEPCRWTGSIFMKIDVLPSKNGVSLIGDSKIEPGEHVLISIPRSEYIVFSPFPQLYLALCIAPCSYAAMPIKINELPTCNGMVEPHLVGLLT